jgi:hypothetical protein
VDPRAGLGYLEKRELLALPGFEHRSHSHPQKLSEALKDAVALLLIAYWAQFSELKMEAILSSDM